MSESDCVKDIVRCMERKKKSRTVWLVICISLFVVGVLLIVFGAEKAEKEEDGVKAAAKLAVSGVLGVISILLSQLMWFVILFRVILDRSQVDLAYAIKRSSSSSRHRSSTTRRSSVENGSKRR
jgi:hypothetical protein